MRENKDSIDGSLACQIHFSLHQVLLPMPKNKIQLVGLDSLANWILTSWYYIHPRVIVKHLVIPFGVGLSLVSMWDFCLQKI
jgi:hypothetical protein